MQLCRTARERIKQVLVQIVTARPLLEVEIFQWPNLKALRIRCSH
jgi:hypothetical protein